MSEPRRSTRARAREEAAPRAPETPTEKAPRGAKASLKRKRTSIAVKHSRPSTPATEGAPLPPKPTLPLRLVDGAPLPTLPEPQPLDLPTGEWQTFQQSRVLETSFERSKAVWLSGANFRTFHTHFTQPKKVADRTEEDKARLSRQKELIKNFPQVGVESAIVKLVIEPHTLPIRLYGPKELAKAVQKKATTSSPYSPWPNHNHQPNQHTKYQNPPPAHHKPQPQPRPQPPKQVQAAPPPQAPSTPAPDPVIHMLAARAGTDPELKAVMKIVAAGNASKEQLEFFQTHISELTAILARQKEEKTHKPPPPPIPTPTLTPASSALPPPPPTPKAIAPPPLPRPVQPVQQQPIHPSAAKPYTPTPPQEQPQYAPPVQQPQPPYTNNYSKPPQYHPQQQVPTYQAPPRTTYRPLVFSFVHGNEDKFYFPSYSFMEWLPNGTGAKLSFLITKLKPKPEPVVNPPSTPAPKLTATPTPAAQPDATPNAPPPNTMTPTPNPSNPSLPPIQPAATAPAPTPAPTPAPAPPTPYVPPKPPQRIEDFDEMNDIDKIEFYQPVTALLLIEKDQGDEVASALPRSIRPPHVVEKYMNEVFDRCKRADETYLAFRLPRDAEEVPEKRVRSGDATPAVATPTQDSSLGGGGGGSTAFDRKKAGRPRRSL
ncbi:hypothetical protein BDW02DRAFT_569687, partial [Decorospora gaudefroyi]